MRSRPCQAAGREVQAGDAETAGGEAPRVAAATATRSSMLAPRAGSGGRSAGRQTRGLPPGRGVHTAGGNGPNQTTTQTIRASQGAVQRGNGAHVTSFSGPRLSRGHSSWRIRAGIDLHQEVKRAKTADYRPG
jgi:hypothetical protein